MDYTPPLGGAPNDPYVDGDPQMAIEGSIVPAAAVEDPQREILNAIVAAGLTASGGDLTQLTQAIGTLAAALTLADDGPGVGPVHDLFRDSATPAAFDQGGARDWSFRNSSAVKILAARIVVELPSPTAGSESALMKLRTRIAGTETNRLFIANGIYTPNATTGDPGADKINAKAYEIDGNDISAPSETVAGIYETATTAEGHSSAAGAKVLTAAKRKDMADWVTLTDAATIALDLDTFVNGKVASVAGNRTLGNPTNGADGLEYTVWLIGDSATARTITFGTNFKGDLPTIGDLTNTKEYMIVIKRLSSTQFTASAKVVKL